MESPPSAAGSPPRSRPPPNPKQGRRTETHVLPPGPGATGSCGNKGSPSASDAERRVQCGDQSGDGGAEAGAGRGSRCVCPQGIRTRKSVSLAAEGGARGGSTLSKSGNSITTTADSILNLKQESPNERDPQVQVPTEHQTGADRHTEGGAESQQTDPATHRPPLSRSESQLCLHFGINWSAFQPCRAGCRHCEVSAGHKICNLRTFQRPRLQSISSVLM
ncbi:hypothetical protein ABFV05_001264 [Capra hircus]